MRFVVNVLRVLSGLAEIPVASSPLWGRTCRASLDELARLAALMPRLAEAFKADTSGAAKGGAKGGKATVARCGGMDKADIGREPWALRKPVLMEPPLPLQ